MGASRVLRRTIHVNGVSGRQSERRRQLTHTLQTARRDSVIERLTVGL